MADPPRKLSRAPFGDDLLAAAREIGRQVFTRQREMRGGTDPSSTENDRRHSTGCGARRLTAPVAGFGPDLVEQARGPAVPTYICYARMLAPTPSGGVS
jgi:hypothetical protein